MEQKYKTKATVMNTTTTNNNNNKNMEDWNSDLLFHVIQYLNVKDMSAFCQQSRRIYYLIHQYRILRGPQLISVASSHCNGGSSSNIGYSTTTDSTTKMRNTQSHTLQQQQQQQYTASELYDQAILKLQGPPQLTLAFSTTENMQESEEDDMDADGSTTTKRTQPLYEILYKRNHNSVFIGAIADTIQTTGINYNPNTRDVTVSSTCECQSSSSFMMLAGLPKNTIIKPFMITMAEGYDFNDDVESFFEDTLCGSIDWKMCILYVVGDGVEIADEFIQSVQTAFPTITIVGGICAAAYVSLPNSGWDVEELMELHDIPELLEQISDLFDSTFTYDTSMTHQDVAEYLFESLQKKGYSLGLMGTGRNRHEDGICGVVLAGDVPIRSVVSRGVESLVSKFNCGDGVPSPSTTLYVHESETVRQDDEGYIFYNESSSYHLIRKIRDDNDGKIYTIEEIIRTYSQSDFLGLRFPNQDGFLLETPHQMSVHLNAFLLIASSIINEDVSLTGANVDFFDLSGEQCMYDMTYCMEQLRNQTAGEEILGAIMFSCNGRGPSAGSFITESMSDAKRFANVFPNVPCLGFYAGGEIGPLALAGRQSVFQQGNACVQGFTAVFALFIVPPFNWETTRKLDDSDASVSAFMNDHFHSK